MSLGWLRNSQCPPPPLPRLSWRRWWGWGKFSCLPTVYNLEQECCRWQSFLCFFSPNYLLLEIWNTWCFQWIFTLKSDKSLRTADVNALLMLSEFRIFSECVHRHVSGLVVPSHSPPYASWLCVFGWLSLGAHLKERDCVKGRSPGRLSGSRVDPDLNWPSHRHREKKKKKAGRISFTCQQPFLSTEKQNTQWQQHCFTSLDQYVVFKFIQNTNDRIFFLY